MLVHITYQRLKNFGVKVQETWYRKCKEKDPRHIENILIAIVTVGFYQYGILFLSYEMESYIGTGRIMLLVWNQLDMVCWMTFHASFKKYILVNKISYDIIFRTAKLKVDMKENNEIRTHIIIPSLKMKPST
jgi:hypothetical protein